MLGPAGAGVSQGDTLEPEDRVKSRLRAWKRLRRDWAQMSF